LIPVVHKRLSDVYARIFTPLINIHKSDVVQFRCMRAAYQMDDASPAPVVISPEAFLTLKRLKNEFEEVIETIEILKYATAEKTD